MKIIDLTHTLNNDITVYPGTVGPKIEVLATVEKDGYRELKAEMVLHSGTHIDAPNHILANTKALDHFPLEKFMGPAIVINCVNRKEIDIAFLRSFEEKIKKIDFILFYTGWQHKWHLDKYFDDCPTLNNESAAWLTQFKLKGIGFDSFSVDPIVSAEKVTPETLPNHHILLGKEILLIENLTNLDELPEGIFQFQCFPIKVENADGSPIRALAFID
jgi:arylformamidase